VLDNTTSVYIYFISAKYFDPTVGHFQALHIVENVKGIKKLQFFNSFYIFYNM